MKALIRAAPDTAMETGLDDEQNTLFALYETDDAQEGIALPQKREPSFKGQ